MYGSFAAKTLANRLNAKEFRCAVDNFVQQAEMELGQYYKTNDYFLSRHYLFDFGLAFIKTVCFQKTK